jgi:hypothetical protein
MAAPLVFILMTARGLEVTALKALLVVYSAVVNIGDSGRIKE